LTTQHREYFKLKQGAVLKFKTKAVLLHPVGSEEALGRCGQGGGGGCNQGGGGGCKRSLQASKRRRVKRLRVFGKWRLLANSRPAREILSGFRVFKRRTNCKCKQGSTVCSNLDAVLICSYFDSDTDLARRFAFLQH
jgi:hypothetical protein